jgi:alanine racemase
LILNIDQDAFGENLLNYWSLVPYFQIGHIFGLFVNNSLKGFAIFTKMWDNPKRVYLVEIGVNKESQGNGYGSYLLLNSILYLKDNGISTVCLTVDPDPKKPNLYFYTKFGFKKVEERKDEYGHGLDRFFLELDLATWMEKMQKSDNKMAMCILSADNLLLNLTTIKKKTPNTKIMAIIKSNAYGHGRISVAKILLKNETHVDGFGLNSINDAVSLRNVIDKIRDARDVNDIPITLIEGVFNPQELICAAETNLSVVFPSERQIAWLQESHLPCKIRAWLKLNTGMNRLGFSPERAESVMEILSNHDSIEQPVGIMSHFACADNPDHPLNVKQISVFRSFIKKYHDNPKCFCNSAALFAFPEMHYDWVRPGLALYGGSPFEGVTAASLDLKPVMTFKSKLSELKKIKKGETGGGYNADFICPEDMMVGIASVGYSHGYPRVKPKKRRGHFFGAIFEFILQTLGIPIYQKERRVLINGVSCPVIEPVMMDMINIDLRNCPDAKVGDEVIFWGDGLPIEDVASDSGRISYDLFCGVGVDRHSKITFEWEQNCSNPFCDRSKEQ